MKDILVLVARGQNGAEIIERDRFTRSVRQEAADRGQRTVLRVYL